MDNLLSESILWESFETIHLLTQIKAFAVTLCECSQQSIPRFQSCLVVRECQLVQSLTPFSGMDVNPLLCKVGSQDSTPCSQIYQNNNALKMLF